MRKLNEQGISALLLPLILTILLLLGAAGFAYWAYTERQVYKNNSDRLSAEAVARAEEAIKQKLEAEFLEREKQPLRTYTSPAAFGSVRIMYPKTWSAYVIEADTSGSSPVNGFFHPSFVPSMQNTNNNFALRLEVVERSYAQEMKTLDSAVKSGKVKVTPYRSAQVPSVLGSRIDGELAQNKRGSMVMFPLRDKTVKLYTQAETFVKDFDESILANLSFVP